MPCFKQIRGEQRTLPASVDSQLPSAQSNPTPKWHIWGWYILIPFKSEVILDKGSVSTKAWSLSCMQHIWGIMKI